MRLPGSSQADPSPLRIANVGSFDCRRPDEELPRRLRYDEIRDDKDKASVIDSYALFSLARILILCLLFSLSFSLFLFCFCIISLSSLSHAVTCIFLATHPLPFLLPIHRVSTQTRGPTISRLRFSHFNATFVSSFATIPIIRDIRTTTSSIMTMTAVPFFLCHPFHQPFPFPRITFVYLLPFDRTFTSFFFYRSYFRNVQNSEVKGYYIERFLIYDSMYTVRQ